MTEEEEEEGKELLVKGDIIFDKDVKSFSGATIYIHLGDVSIQDAPSKLITRQVIKDVRYDDLAENHHQKKLEFELFDDILSDSKRKADHFGP